MDQYDRDRDGFLDEIQDPDNPGAFIDSDVDDNGFLDRIEAIDPRTGLPGTEYEEGDRYLNLDQLTKYYEGFENFVSPWARERAPLELISPGTVSGDNSDAVTNWGQGLQTALSETTDLVAEGYEFELTYNPTSNMRIALNITQQEARRSNIAPNLTRYFEQWVGFIEAAGPDGPFIPTGNNLLHTPLRTQAWAANSHGGRPLRQSSVGGNYFKQVALAGSDNPEVREYRVNILGNYSFTEGRLKGFNVGGALRWQDEAAIGYPVVSQEAFGLTVPISDVFNPYFDDGHEFFDAWIGYRGKIFDDKVDWRIQLNIRNVFADGDPVPIQRQPDGSVARVSIPVPRQFVLSNTFSF